MNWIPAKAAKFLNSPIVKNSGWGLMSNIVQVLFVCIFFSIVARKFTTDEFAKFLISTTIYQIVAAFSSMGLGQWFIRQYVEEIDRSTLINKYLKTQSLLGIAFYVINIVIAYMLYADNNIRVLCVILGVNIIFDNLINALKSLNIAEHRQNKTAPILILDGFLKLLLGICLLFTPFSPVVLAVLLIAVRLFSLGFFIKIGTSGNVSLRKLLLVKISYEDLKNLISRNWQFMVIGSISIVYWRMGNIIISKTLTMVNIAEYEISFRVFSLLQIVPLVVSASIFPQLVKYANQKDPKELKYFYNSIFLIAAVFSILCYAFTFSFSGIILSFAFGRGYPGATLCLQQMSLSLLFIPTVLLQANLIVAIKLEKLDMWLNIGSLLVYITLCTLGLHFIRSLSIVNFSIFISFFVFHLFQDIILIRKKLTSVLHSTLFYIILISVVLIYQFITNYLNSYLCFVLLLMSTSILMFILMAYRKQEHLESELLKIIN